MQFTNRFVIVLISCLFAGSAVARDGSFSVTPRLYLTNLDTSSFSERLVMPLAGISLTYAPNAGRDFTLNVLSGDGDSDFTDLARSFGAGWGEDGDYEANRDDYEILVRFRPGQGGVYYGVGFRTIDFETDFVGDSGINWEHEETELWFLQGAVGFSTQISESGRHALFGNVIVGLGQFDWKSAEVVGVNTFLNLDDDGSATLFDVNVGYQYVVSPVVSLSARYRVIAIGTKGSEEQSVPVNGPEIAASFRF